MKKLSVNVLVSIASTFVVAFCGILINQRILSCYGPEASGLLQSVSRFLSVVTLLEGGFGNVVKASLYEPLSNKDAVKLCKLFNSIKSIFFKLGLIVFCYSIVLGLLFKPISKSSFDTLTCFGLVIAVSCTTIVEYVFGISYTLILNSDQKVYISSGVNIIFYLLRVLLVYFFAYFKRSLLELEICITFVLLAKAFVIRFYTRYCYNLTITKERSPLHNRWDGLIHHIAYTIHANVDVILITIFLGLTNVSIYSVYSLVVSAVSKIIKAISTGTAATVGRILASKDRDKLCDFSENYVLVSCVISTSMFSSISLIILFFVQLYTRKVVGVDYIYPLYAYLIIAAEAVAGLRNPIKTIIDAAGHYKQTRNSAIIEAVINGILSLTLIVPFGIAGILFATLVAMLYRTIYLVIYLCKNILNRESKIPYIIGFNLILTFFLECKILIYNYISIDTYMKVFGIGFLVGIIDIVIIGGLNIFIFKKSIKSILSYL